MSGATLAVMNIAEYYEIVLIFGIFGLFIVNEYWWSWIVAAAVCMVIYFAEILWDNVSARLKWNQVLAGCWIVTLLTGGLNLLILMLIK